MLILKITNSVTKPKNNKKQMIEKKYYLFLNLICYLF